MQHHDCPKPEPQQACGGDRNWALRDVAEPKDRRCNPHSREFTRTRGE